MGRLELRHAPAQTRARSCAHCEPRRRFCGLGRRRLVENALERGQHLFWELSFGAAGREGLADRLPLDILALERLPELRELFLRCFHVNGTCCGCSCFGPQPAAVARQRRKSMEPRTTAAKWRCKLPLRAVSSHHEAGSPCGHRPARAEPCPQHYVRVVWRCTQRISRPLRLVAGAVSPRPPSSRRAA
jgi:hypothetical protein